MNAIEETIPTHKKRTLPEIKLNSIENQSKKQRLWLALKTVCWEYVENTQVHGFFYLRAVEKNRFKRIFWSIALVFSFLIGAFILGELVAQFFRVPFQITVGNSELLLSISFPGISLCHPQTVINYKAKQFVDEINVPDGLDKADLIRMLPTALGIFTENQWGPVDINSLTAVNEILQLNRLSVADAVRAVGIKCPELVTQCSFNRKRFPCFQDDEQFTIRETMSRIGVCCSFNYNPQNLSYNPMRVNSFGVRGGLSIVGTSFPHSNDGTSGLLFSDGFVMLIHRPHDFPTEESMTLLEVGKITSVAVYPTISTVSADVNELPLKYRRCLVGNDVGLPIYRRPACTIKCLTNFIYDKCECHPYFLPAMDGDETVRNCTVLDGECFQKYFYDMKKIRCTSCLPSCEDISYRMSTATVSYSFANTSINPMYEQKNVTTAEFTAHTYFAGSTVPVKRKIISQSFIQLLANFGGVFNLVLGVSVFSILELFYYFCIKIPLLMNMHEKVRPVITSIQPVNKIYR